MDSMEFNKVFGAVLVAGIAFVGLGIVADNAVHPARLEKTAIDIKGADAPATAAAAPAEAPVPPIAPLLVSATPANGEALTKKVCVACHNFKQGGPNLVGPNLYGVVGRAQASAPGYTYSAALKSHTGKWTYAELNKWLLKPSAYAPGTKMAYAGIGNDQLRADTIAYLRTLAPTPEPLPTAAEAAAETAAAAKAVATQKTAAAAPATAEAAAGAPNIEPLLASADPAGGQAFTKKVCVACHNFKEGGPNLVGPNLYGVFGRPRASVASYTYSSALKGKPGNWTAAELNKWLYKPSAYAPGTKMAYAGITNDKTRAEVIAYLHTLAANPAPLTDGSNGAATKPATQAPSNTAPASPQSTETPAPAGKSN